MNLLDALHFRDVIWLLPVAVALHVLEELPRFPAWANRTLHGVTYTRAKFLFENLALFLILLAALLMTQWLPAATTGGKLGVVLTLGAAAGLVCNIIFHAYHTLRSGIYSPGTVTACLLFAPVSSLVFWKAAQAGLVTPFVGTAAVVLGIVLLPVVVALVHRTIDRRWRITRRSVIKIAVAVVVPPVVMSALGALIGGAELRKVMTVLGPLALLPLLVNCLVQRARRSAPEAKR